MAQRIDMFSQVLLAIAISKAKGYDEAYMLFMWLIGLGVFIANRNMAHAMVAMATFMTTGFANDVERTLQLWWCTNFAIYVLGRLTMIPLIHTFFHILSHYTIHRVILSGV